jgi:hypothetical protein
MGLLFGAFLCTCTVCSIGVLYENTKITITFNNERNFTKFLLYAYLVRVHNISIDKFLCPIGGAFRKLKSKSSSRCCGCSNLSQIGTIVMKLNIMLPITRALMGLLVDVRFVI